MGRNDQDAALDTKVSIAMKAARPAAYPRLVFTSDATPGLRRVSRGDKFEYVEPDGTPVTDPDVLARIASLAVPPAYTDVWICKNPLGHLQATGRDARGRKQYRYHAKWRVVRDHEKFDRMAEFGRALPKLRRRVGKDLQREGLCKEKVAALAVHLLDTTRVRIGNEEYTRQNRSYGLTTLRNRHLRFVDGEEAILSFRGKSGVEHDITIRDRETVGMLKQCKALPGQHLLQYVDETGRCRRVTSDVVNEYLRNACGGDFSAKDFRTWSATLHALRLLVATPLPEPLSQRAATRCINDAIRAVAQTLANTAAVCRKSYINPQVFDAWRRGDLHLPAYQGLGKTVRQAELAAISLLDAWSRDPADALIELARSKPPKRAARRGDQSRTVTRTLSGMSPKAAATTRPSAR